MICVVGEQAGDLLTFCNVDQNLDIRIAELVVLVTEELA